MDKRGQVYILAALLLSLVVFGIVLKVNSVRRDIIDDDFEELSNDYERESSRFINTLISKNQLDTFGDDYLEFTVDFTRYSKTQNPEFGLIYLFDFIFEDVHTLYVGNYLDEDIIVGVGDVPTEDLLDKSAIVEGCKSLITAGYSFEGLIGGDSGLLLEDVSHCSETLGPLFEEDSYTAYFLIGDIVYTTDIAVGVPEVIIVSKEIINEQRKIYLNDDFITGETEDTHVLCSEGTDDQGSSDDPDNDDLLEDGICKCETQETEELCKRDFEDIECQWEIQDDGSGKCIDV